jgi:hypothetical protein
MHAVLAKIIGRFRAAQDRGVATLVEELRVPLPNSNREWVSICGDYGLYKLRGINGIGVYTHGYGIELIFDDITIDFDWGDAGEPDGFDTWRLWNFVNINKLDVACEACSQIGAWLEEAYRDGELTRDRLLYYSPAHRATSRSRKGD